MTTRDHGTDGDGDRGLLDRRRFIQAATAATAGSALMQPLVGCGAQGQSAAERKSPYRVAVIGHTGRGDYGHGLDVVWRDVPGTRVVAVADADAKGLAEAVKRLGDVKGFADYRKMLDEIKPDLVSIAPRWLDEHRDMVVAAAERGVRGIYMEKPMCRTLAEADEMVAAVEKNKVKLAIAHQTRYSPKLPVIQKLIDDGQLGRMLEIRTRGKEDPRGGGEDLWVLGTHVLNLMQHFGGAPKSCFATVYQGGRPITAKDLRPGAEGIGPLAGDEVHAVYRLATGTTGYFDSIRGGGEKPRFGIQIFGSKGIVEMFDTGHLPKAFFLADPGWSPGRSGKGWQPINSGGVGKPETMKSDGLATGNILAVQDLIASIEEDRQPASSIYEARTSIEMIVAVFASQRAGGPVEVPLKERGNPLEKMG